MAKMTVTEEAFDALGKLQNDILRSALAGELDTTKAVELVDAIGVQVGKLRRTYSRVLQAVRGELNEDHAAP